MGHVVFVMYRSHTW